jgi:hypothetical protein
MPTPSFAVRLGVKYAYPQRKTRGLHNAATPASCAHRNTEVKET